VTRQARPLRVLVVNAGSSSLKLRLLDGDDTVAASADLAATAGEFASDQVGTWVRGLPEPVGAVGHRVVHGGADFTGPVRLDERVDARLRELTDLAPLHQAASLAGIDALTRVLPDVAAVACFDTAFHATLPPAAATYAVPRAWREGLGVRRFGFHGLSHAYAAGRAAQLLERPAASLRLVTCHIGAGASLAAVDRGRSVDTTMGFTPLDGLVMATRSGDLDPGLVLWLQDHAGLTTAEMGAALEYSSGLTGLAGTADMQVVVARRAAGDPDARLAFDVYVHRLRAGIAAMAASLGGADAVVFTGGVGEHSPQVRAAAVGGLRFLGLSLDPRRNEAASAGGSVSDMDVSARTARVRTLVVAAREDLRIAAETRRVLTTDR
jgi:acetate kinase